MWVWRTTLEIARQLKEGGYRGRYIRPMLDKAAKNASDQSLSNANFQVLDVQVDDMPSDFDTPFLDLALCFLKIHIRRFQTYTNL